MYDRGSLQLAFYNQDSTARTPGNIAASVIYDPWAQGSRRAGMRDFDPEHIQLGSPPINVN